ncbi:hypothetical protein HZS61_012292 [Fusarium oxysporum f. sp. conglutinans]|uniref:Uncharacterized protein n=1 Tax=Fusarium oxysporum f. sp. conglutinans TaxID=100902 RepID=A0A8H6GSY9_FUSOX|nr:hypothetical protein HZS61_012292 [Fusarium oxysporum f. sp. conglutinans]
MKGGKYPHIEGASLFEAWVYRLRLEFRLSGGTLSGGYRQLLPIALGTRHIHLVEKQLSARRREYRQTRTALHTTETNCEATHRENIRNEGRRDIICTVTQPQLGAHKPTLSAASSLDPFQLEN